MTSRYLIAAARRRGLVATAALHAALGVAFLTTWGATGRVPVLNGSNLYEQSILLQAMFMAIVSPWIVARVADSETGDDVGRLALQYGVSTAAVHRGRALVAILWVVIVQAVALPAAIEAQQLAGVTATAAAIGQLQVLAAGLAGALLGCGVAARIDNGLARWVAPAVLTTVIVMVAA